MHPPRASMHAPPTAPPRDLQIYPEGGGELGWDLNKVAEVLGHCGEMPGALRLWQDGARLLRASFGETRATMGVIFKAEYFRDEDMHRRMELVKRLGPYLPEQFTRGIADNERAVRDMQRG